MNSGGTLACALVVLPAVIFVAQDCMAAGFAIKEQSGAALGNAFAGSASGIDDNSYSLYNPSMVAHLFGTSMPDADINLKAIRSRKFLERVRVACSHHRPPGQSQVLRA